MKNFPTDFAEKTEALKESLFEAADAELVRQLSDKGFEIHAGLTKSHADDIAQICRQPSIQEYCPNDVGRRFTDIAATEKWLSKGRLTFLLLKKKADGYSLVGYGWAGNETSSRVPGGKVTFAVRVGEAGQGHGLATPFSRLMISATAILQQAEDFWLETWSSNGGAVHIYHKLGFEDVDQVKDERPSFEGGTVEDVRLYMKLPNERLK